MSQPDRSIVFIDGNNWYHSMVGAGITGLGQLNYAKISQKIIGARDWIETRYYIGQVKQQNPYLYAEQRKFVAFLKATDSRISVHFGRLEPRRVENSLAPKIRNFAANLSFDSDPEIYKGLMDLARQNEFMDVFVEKAVDVMLAVDLVTMAEHDSYDSAYILSADGDYTPAVQYVSSLGKKVFAASFSRGAQLAAAVHKFIPLQPDWIKGCY